MLTGQSLSHWQRARAGGTSKSHLSSERPVLVASSSHGVVIVVDRGTLCAGGGRGHGRSVDHWHITSGRQLHTITEEDNQIFCVDYNYDGAKFAAAGKDYKVTLAALHTFFSYRPLA